MNEQTLTFTITANSGGCPQNQLDGAQAFNYLTNNGYAYTPSVEAADLIIINSCAYKNEKENQSLAIYRSVSEKAKPGAKIVFSGCMPKIAPERLKDVAPGVAVIPGTELHTLEAVIPPQQHVTWIESTPHSIPSEVLAFGKPSRKYLNAGLNACRSALPYAAARHFDRLLMYDHSKDTFIIPVAQGCLSSCTYCAIRFSRGRLRSRAIADVLEDVSRAVERGVPEVMLTATDLAAYGRDLGLDLSCLLREILALAPRQHLLLFYANPRWMIDIREGLEEVFASQRIHFIHLSLNGGSESVLQRMKRGYTLHDFERLVRMIKRVSPMTVLQTQIITGFPGETEEDFDETRRFLQRNYFHNVQIHAFDPRPGTAAATMADQVPETVREARRKELYRLTLKEKLAYDMRYIVNGFRPPKAAEEK